MTCTLAIIGATGQVGRLALDLITERAFPYDHLRLFASARSAGTTTTINGHTITIEDPATANLDGITIAIFSAGATTSRTWAPRFASAGATVIDNSSAYRREDDVPLIVTEVNPDQITNRPRGIIANPNCTTMVAMPVIAPLHRVAQLTAMTVATYQAVSGSGVNGVRTLATELRALADHLETLATDPTPARDLTSSIYPAPIACNIIPLAGSYAPDGTGETDEDQKLRNETRKILNHPTLPVTGTCVRVPVMTGHSLCIHAQFAQPITPDEATEILRAAPGVTLSELPTPLAVTGTNTTLVGRIRHDQTVPDGRGLVLFLSGDNLRKGAALNALQIAELLIQDQAGSDAVKG